MELLGNYCQHRLHEAEQAMLSPARERQPVGTDSSPGFSKVLLTAIEDGKKTRRLCLIILCWTVPPGAMGGLVWLLSHGVHL